MTQRIFKYPIGVAAVQVVTIPRGAEYLCVQSQFDEPMIWALVDPDAPMESHSVLIVGTGHPIPEGSLAGMRYLGTLQMRGFVWHVFVPGAV